MGRSVGRLPGTEQGFFSYANKRGEIQPRIARITRMKIVKRFPFACFLFLIRVIRVIRGSTSFLLFQKLRGGNERDVGEGLRKIAKQPFFARIIFLRQ